MSLTDAIAGLFGWRRVVVYDHSVVAANIAGMTATDLYRRQPALRAVVSFLADNVAGVPIKCYVREDDTDRPRDTKSPLALLLSRPSAGMTTFELMRATESDLKLWGQSLWSVVPDEAAPSGWRIQYIPWSWVGGKDTWDGFEPSVYRVVNPYTGGRAELPAEDCIRFYGYSPTGTMDASSPIDALKDVLSEQISAWEFRNGVWRNGGRVQQWISRPQGAEWAPGARDRFTKSWKERYSGKDGDNTGGTPLLEDGMRLEATQLNAREAQWQEATRLAREDVAAVYHVNPSQIWHSDAQTYASAKDNARALYADTLANDFALIEQRVNAVLVPMLGLDPARHYCEFDLSAKLAASFEEQAGVLQSSVGGPWMLRNEARARMNLPAIDGGDELIVPLNVTEGGLASPNDTDPTKARPALDVRVEPVVKGGDAAPFGHSPSAKEADGSAVVLLKSSAEPPEDIVDEMRGAIAKFVERQSRRVLADIEAAGDDWDKRSGHVMTKDGLLDLPPWWDAVRWDRELADDLEPLFRQLCDLRGTAAMADIGEDASLWSSRRTSNFVRSMVERRAALFNRGTYEDVRKALMQAEGPAQRLEGAMQAFATGAENRAVRGARTFATAVCGFATKEAVRQVYPRDTDRVRRTKTWRHHSSKNPRSNHAAMDGETVGLDEYFSNGADYPGDLGLSAQETVNCGCTMDVGVEKKTYSLSSITLRSDGYMGSEVREFEEARFFDADNNPIGGFFRGDDYHVHISCPDGYEWENVRTCHTHPHGGTFSVYSVDSEGNESGDIFTFTDSGMLSSDVVTENHVYSIARTAESSPTEFLSEARKAYEDYRIAAIDVVLDRFIIEHPGELYTSEYDEEYEPLALQVVSKGMDAWYTKNSKRFGYSYTKTRR